MRPRGHFLTTRQTRLVKSCLAIHAPHIRAYVSRMKHLVLVRLASELTLKAKRTRSMFTSRLVRNLEDALVSTGLAHKIETRWGRIYVHTDSPAALPVVARVFGISSCSLVDRVV